MNRPTATLVGSRETVKGDVQKVWVVTGLLNRLGYDGRSGGAPGMDEEWAINMDFCQRILPNDGFQGFYHDGHGILALDYAPLNIHNKAASIAEQHHGYWDNLKDWHKKAHTRNAMQVLGANLDDPSKLTIYAAFETKHGKVSGGTSTAVEISRSYGVPTYNIRDEKQYEALLAFLNAQLESKVDS